MTGRERERKERMWYKVREANSWAEQLWLTKAKISFCPLSERNSRKKKKKKNPPIFGLNKVTTMEVLKLSLKTCP